MPDALPSPGWSHLKVRSNGTTEGTRVYAVLCDGTEREVVNVSQVRLVADRDGALVRLEVVGPDVEIDVKPHRVVLSSAPVPPPFPREET